MLETEIEQLKSGASPDTPGNVEPPPGSPTWSNLPAEGSYTILTPNTPPFDHEDSNQDAEHPPPAPAYLASTMVYKYIFQIDNRIPAYGQPDDVQLSLACDWSRYFPQLPGIPFTRHEHDTTLFRALKYGTSWLLGLVPELFLRDMLHSLASTGTQVPPRPRLQHYSPLLHCSIMAFATAFSESPVIRAPETRGRFASWAKQWLAEELQRPTMSLIRSLALLAEYHCGIGEKNAGYIYMGMSFRAARIVMPQGNNEGVPREAIVESFPETISRNWHFWSTFGHGAMAQHYLFVSSTNARTNTTNNYQTK
ncbi:hypothetical protein FS749_000811 [Ceratobasidium sp. UAMH 11750]|nr:hypothetical protein FS749_000811 [Ceratobasidium sp. UAMH 11750]